jgi:hypothetical protein
VCCCQPFGAVSLSRAASHCRQSPRGARCGALFNAAAGKRFLDMPVAEFETNLRREGRRRL